MTVLGHFDGKSIILDDEIDLPRNQLLTLRIEQVNSPTLEEESALSWLASNAVMTDLLPPDLAERHDHFLLTIPTEGDPR